jgi:phosphatidylserine/phosphatidylglycerophosphate/cardiolipin synthase-like enzyme
VSLVRPRRFSALVAALACTLVGHASAQIPSFAGLDGGGEDGTRTRPRTLREAFEAFPRSCHTAGCEVGEAHLITDGPEAWAARWALLASAKRSIDMTYFIIHDDIFGMSLLAHLLRIKRAKPGVRVRLLLDAAGSPKFKLAGEGGKDILQELAAAGVEVKLYVPMYKGVARAVTSGDLLTGIASNHDKIIVVDDTWAISGGRNVSADYYTSAADHPKGFEDSDILIHGAGAARGLTQAFEAEWTVEKNSTITPDRGGDWVSRDERLFLYFHTMDQWMRSSDMGGPATALRSDQAAQDTAAEQLFAAARAATEADASAGLLELRGSWRVVTNSAVTWKAMRHVRELVRYPDNRGTAGYDLEGSLDMKGEIRILDRVSRMNPTGADSIAPNLVEILGTAKESIYIANPYVVLLGAALEALKVAGSNGVKTTILTNSPISTDSLVTQAYFLQQWPELMAQVPNLHIHVMNGDRKLHAKVASVDDQLTLVGTYNMDLISARINSEVIVAIWGEGFAAKQRGDIDGWIEEPGNDTQEYTIARDPETGAPRRDGDGRVEVDFGPEDHIDADDLSAMKQRTLELLKGAAGRVQGMDALRELLPVDPKQAARDLALD